MEISPVLRLLNSLGLMKIALPCLQHLLKATLPCLLVSGQILLSPEQITAQPASHWIYPGKDGKLIYSTLPTGDRIMDFSYAGYMGGGVALPTNVPVRRTLHPSGAPDDTQLIQAAINEVATMPPENGFRGTIQLAAGSFTCSGTLYIPASGIVLKGSGSGTIPWATVLKHVFPAPSVSATIRQ